MLTAALAIVACGTVHGLWTNRWQLSDEPARSAAKLRDVSLVLGDWEGEVGKEHLAKDMAGALFHRYRNRKTGQVVTVFVVCDRPGPVSIHTPDVCYEAAGYEVSKPARFTAPGDEDISFWTARFHKKRSADGAGDLRIFWSWNAGQGWQAADDARLSYARFPALYKLYLIYELPGDENLADGPPVQLMKQLLPELQRALFAS
jgi:hypothetical protein